MATINHSFDSIANEIMIFLVSTIFTINFFSCSMRFSFYILVLATKSLLAIRPIDLYFLVNIVNSKHTYVLINIMTYITFLRNSNLIITNFPDDSVKF